jgi:ribosomal protein S18 acetylase RimI-like enzyme
MSECGGGGDIIWRCLRYRNGRRVESRSEIVLIQAVEIRDFRMDDGTACHALRRTAFLEVFSRFLPEDAVRAGAESYGVAEFTERLGGIDTTVATIDNVVSGFCSIQLHSPTRAEILYLYIGADQQGVGLGSRLVRRAERQALLMYSQLETIFLDTAVPEYNRAFWERIGYNPAGSSYCEYPTGRIPSLRMEKRVGSLAERQVDL